MEADPLFHRERWPTAEEERERKRKYTRKGKLRRRYRRKPKANIAVYQGGAPGLRQQRR